MAECSPSSRNRGLGTLSTLPLEIREMIYALLFCAGHIALARVSEAIYEDTKTALFQHGVHRMRIDYLPDSRSYSWISREKLSAVVLARIKNLHVWVTLYDLGKHRISTMRHLMKDDDIVYCYQATWISGPDDKSGIFHQPGIAGVANSAVLSTESHSLVSLLRQLVDQIEKPSHCVFECKVLPRTSAVPSTVFDSMELLRKFPRVETDFSYGSCQTRKGAEEILEGYNHAIATISKNIKQILGPRGEREQGPELKISHKVSYFANGGCRDMKYWGDEPEDKDYGLGEWTETMGRVWPPKSA